MELLELSDPRWKDLKATYSNGTIVAAQLADLEAGRLLNESESVLWQELCHEYESTEAGYAAIPHLVRMSEQAEGERALFLLGIAAYVLSCAQREVSQEMPDFLRPSLDVACKRALGRDGTLLKQVSPSPANSKALAYMVAAFMKDAQLFFAIEGLDARVTCPKCAEHFFPEQRALGLRNPKV